MLDQSLHIIVVLFLCTQVTCLTAKHSKLRDERVLISGSEQQKQQFVEAIVSASPLEVSQDRIENIDQRAQTGSVHTPTQHDMETARALLENAYPLFAVGAYAEAEQLVQRAIALNPLFPQAHVLLAKIYLLRGVAANDQALLHQARQVLEQAHHIAPEMEEPTRLLKLCDDAHIE